jgi:hypothetical protein
VFTIVSTGQNNFKMNDLENRLFQDFVRPPQRRSNVLFTAVHPLLKGSSGLVFAAGSSDPIQVCEEAALDSESSPALTSLL